MLPTPLPEILKPLERGVIVQKMLNAFPVDVHFADVGMFAKL